MELRYNISILSFWWLTPLLFLSLTKPPDSIELKFSWLSAREVALVRCFLFFFCLFVCLFLLFVVFLFCPAKNYSYFSYFSTKTMELQWLEHLWNHGNVLETRVVRAIIVPCREGQSISYDNDPTANSLFKIHLKFRMHVHHQLTFSFKENCMWRVMSSWRYVITVSLERHSRSQSRGATCIYKSRIFERENGERNSWKLKWSLWWICSFV